MKPFYKIMIPVDFSPVLHKAFEFINLLKDKAEIEIHLVHVLESETFSPWNLTTTPTDQIPPEIKFLWEQASSKLALISQTQPVLSTIYLGSLSEALSYYAIDQAIDLIVMGTKEKKSWWEQAGGTTASQLIQVTRMPVISIHQNAQVSPIQHIAWVADFPAEEQSNHSIAFIKKLQGLFNAQLHLLHIIEQPEIGFDTEISNSMQLFAKSYHLENYEIHVYPHEKVADGVRGFNQESSVELVAIGARAPRKALSFLFKNSIPDTMVEQCIRPLLTCYLD